MPIYEYRCAECGHTFEEIQRFSDPDPEACPACDAGDVGRLVSRSNFQLKGGGWYADDYESSSSSSSSSTPSTTEDTATESSAGDSGTDGGEQAAAE